MLTFCPAWKCSEAQNYHWSSEHTIAMVIWRSLIIFDNKVQKWGPIYRIRKSEKMFAFQVDLVWTKNTEVLLLTEFDKKQLVMSRLQGHCRVTAESLQGHCIPTAGQLCNVTWLQMSGCVQIWSKIAKPVNNGCLVFFASMLVLCKLCGLTFILNSQTD